MTRVYAISRGSYSDKTWGPVFSTIEKARTYERQHPDDYFNELQVHVLDEENDTGPAYPSWLLVFDSHANVLRSIQEDDAMPYEPLVHDRRTEVFPNKPGNVWYFLDGEGIREKAVLIVRHIRAPDVEHAIKIGNEKRSQYLATH